LPEDIQISSPESKFSFTRGEPKGKQKMEIYKNTKQQEFTEQTHLTYGAREE